jgi:hypothetical protein
MGAIASLPGPKLVLFKADSAASIDLSIQSPFHVLPFFTFLNSRLQDQAHHLTNHNYVYRYARDLHESPDFSLESPDQDNHFVSRLFSSLFSRRYRVSNLSRILNNTLSYSASPMELVIYSIANRILQRGTKQHLSHVVIQKWAAAIEELILLNQDTGTTHHHNVQKVTIRSNPVYRNIYQNHRLQNRITLYRDLLTRHIQRIYQTHLLQNRITRYRNLHTRHTRQIHTQNQVIAGLQLLKRVNSYTASPLEKMMYTISNQVLNEIEKPQLIEFFHQNLFTAIDHHAYKEIHKENRNYVVDPEDFPQRRIQHNHFAGRREFTYRDVNYVTDLFSAMFSSHYNSSNLGSLFRSTLSYTASPMEIMMHGITRRVLNESHKTTIMLNRKKPGAKSPTKSPAPRYPVIAHHVPTQGGNTEEVIKQVEKKVSAHTREIKHQLAESLSSSFHTSSKASSGNLSHLADGIYSMILNRIKREKNMRGY